MMLIGRPPEAGADVTGEVMQIIRDGQPQFRRWVLWPFTLTVMTYNSGSKNWSVEFRPIWKFPLSAGFFWKASPPK